MVIEKLNRLKEVLAIPTYSRSEELMIEYVSKVMDEKGYDYRVDDIGNIYITKGVSENYPCFIAHTDTVHFVNKNLTVREVFEEGKTILSGYNHETNDPLGIGGDDKCGVFLCLEMLDKLDVVKVALFVSEEIGCIGSAKADPEFFKNVSYGIQYDSPEGDSMSMSLLGYNLFEKESDFGGKVAPLILEHGIVYWERHPYTDVIQIVQKFNIPCLNLAAGYYRYHTKHEYVIVEDVENAFELGLKLVETLGSEKYKYNPQKINTKMLF